MKSYLFILLLLTGLFLLSTCNKNEEGDYNTSEADYIINFQDDKLVSYQKYDRTANALEAEGMYDYQDNKVIHTVMQNGKLRSRNIYIMQDNLAVESYDTVYRNDTTSDVYHNLYFHSNGKLVERRSQVKHFTGDSVTVYNWVYEYTWSGERDITMLSKTADVMNGSQCNDVYTYTEKPCKFDVHNFSSGFTGEKSTHLRKTLQYNTGCPGGPGYIYPESTYNYEINDDGYVVMMTETYVAGYASSTMVKRNSFVYNFK